MQKKLALFLLMLFALIPVGHAQAVELMLEWDPAHNSVAGRVELQGTVNIPDLQWFFAEVAPYGGGDGQWLPIIIPQMQPVIDDHLGTWNTKIIADGVYQLRLHAVNSAQESVYYAVGPIAVANEQPIALSESVAVIEASEQSRAPVIENRLPVPVGGHVLHFGEDAQAAMHAAGMTWVKWQIHYFDGEDLTVARDRIKRSHEAGFLALLSITGHKEDLAAGGDAYLDDYAAFLGEVAALGPDAIEVWNEMNLDREWPTGQISPAHYVRMLQKAYSAIKAAKPDTLVITGALAPTGAEGFFGSNRVWNDDRYYLGLANAGAASYADCIGAHYNEGILPPSAQGGDPRDEYPTRYLPLMLARVAFPFRDTGLPMCITEMGYLSPEGYGQLPPGFEWAHGTSVSEQAQWLAQAIQIAGNFRQMPVELAIVWNIDFDKYGADPQAGYAIIRPDGNCPACEQIAALQI